MRKVKEYLDENFYQLDEVDTQERKNGHLGVFGTWEYPKDYKPISFEEWTPEHRAIDHIRCSCNNETLRIDIIINNKLVGYYSYLQTYEHIPRGLPDSHGYYARSTDEEVIKYIDSYYQIIARKEIRKKKLQLLNEV